MRAASPRLPPAFHLPTAMRMATMRTRMVWSTAQKNIHQRVRGPLGIRLESWPKIKAKKTKEARLVPESRADAFGVWPSRKMTTQFPV